MLEDLLKALFGSSKSKTRSTSRQTPANTDQPYIKSVASPGGKKLANYWWSQVFYNDDNLKRLAGKHPVRPRQGYGLVYRYIVKDKVRYVGQTGERSLKWRMTKKQANGQSGYRPVIKKRLLNAYRAGVLRIETEQLPLSKLDGREKALIESYPASNRLWNVEHNPHFDRRNYRY